MSNPEDGAITIVKNEGFTTVRGKTVKMDTGLDSVLIDGREVGHCRRVKGAPFFATTRELSESEKKEILQVLARHHAQVLDGAEEDDADAVINNLDRQVAVPPPVEEGDI